jgi:hypothetical protein
MALRSFVSTPSVIYYLSLLKATKSIWRILFNIIRTGSGRHDYSSNGNFVGIKTRFTKKLSIKTEIFYY